MQVGSTALRMGIAELKGVFPADNGDRGGERQAQYVVKMRPSLELGPSSDHPRSKSRAVDRPTAGV